MSDTIRTFIAVKSSMPSALNPVMTSLAAMKWPVATVSPQNLHVTLKFLGETPVESRDQIQERIAESISGQPPFVARVEGLGAFPRAERPSVIWVGLLEADPLIRFADRLEAALEPLGFACEARPFHPHLTLARIKGRPPRELFDLLRHHAQTHFGNFEVHAVEFIHSDRQRDGSHYSTLASFELR